MKTDGRAVQEKFAGTWLFQAGQHLHKGAFAGTIFADQPMDLTAHELEIDFIERADASESLGKVFD
jgi:hypothetical protein